MTCNYSVVTKVGLLCVCNFEKICFMFKSEPLGPLPGVFLFFRVATFLSFQESFFFLFGSVHSACQSRAFALQEQGHWGKLCPYSATKSNKHVGDTSAPRATCSVPTKKAEDFISQVQHTRPSHWRHKTTFSLFLPFSFFPSYFLLPSPSLKTGPARLQDSNQDELPQLSPPESNICKLSLEQKSLIFSLLVAAPTTRSHHVLHSPTDLGHASCTVLHEAPLCFIALLFLAYPFCLYIFHMILVFQKHIYWK